MEPLIDKEILLEKSPGKGGWTYAIIPGIPREKRQHFGGLKVNGTIDHYELKGYTLMPMGNGMLFLPVKAEIRKQIGKKEGDRVRITLYAAAAAQAEVLPDDFMECLKDEPAAWAAFTKLPKATQQECITWIMEAAAEETRIQRMADAITNLAAGKAYGPGKK